MPTKQKVSLNVGNYLRIGWDGLKSLLGFSRDYIMEKVLDKAPVYFWVGLLIIIGLITLL